MKRADAPKKAREQFTRDQGTSAWLLAMLAEVQSMRAVPIEKMHTHGPELCAGQVCCIHNPSNHWMRGWRQVWRPDRAIVERICPHGVGFPDPDDLKVKAGDDVYGGCGKCRIPHHAQ